MTFEEIWRAVKGLPDTAMIQVPVALSSETKKRLVEHTPEEVAKLVIEAIDEINHGSIAPLDTLIKQKL